MATVYKLRCSVVGHEKDVRSVAATIYPDNGILSGSRDVSARVWAPNTTGNDFIESRCMRGHSNFVSAVCIAPPDDAHPQGLIFTASNDATILVYSSSSTDPIYKLTGHSSNVCTLASGKFGTLVSGSWDKTAKVWLKEKCVMTLEGHEAAVWAVAVIPEHGYMLTGSADKTIKLWVAGKVKHTYKGHADCVRGLAVLPNAEFLSCSNDATIRRWTSLGDCLHIYYGHTNYIYSLSVLPNGEDFVSCGEDRTLRVWKKGECVQTIAHPCESVWAVCCLQNGDIVTGSCDGVIRVFTCNPGRMANEAEQAALEELVSASTIPTQIGDIKMDELPGPEALVNPGKRDGQSKMVREGKVVMLYHWDSAGVRWVKMGEIVGASGGSQATSGKKLFEGQEYDYVFDVDIEEGKPPLKLPYNITEDPWTASQRFLNKNQLSQLFLDQVANFIQSNSKGVTLGQSTNVVSDPFTGGGRYVPGSHANGMDHSPSDPFTGASSYRSGDGPARDAGNKYFPQKEYLTFANANSASVISKLKEFNREMEVAMSEVVFTKIDAIIEGVSVSQDHLNILSQLLMWPPDKIFPVLDVVRLAIRHETINKYFCLKGKSFLDEVYLQHITVDSHPNNKLLSLRIITNLFNQTTGVEYALSHYETIFQTLQSASQSPNKNIQIATSSVLLNYAVAMNKKPDEKLMIDCLTLGTKILDYVTLDKEAIFRLLVCIGTLVLMDQIVLVTAQSIDVKRKIEPLFKITDPMKVSECAKFIANAL